MVESYPKKVGRFRENREVGCEALALSSAGKFNSALPPVARSGEAPSRFADIFSRELRLGFAAGCEAWRASSRFAYIFSRELRRGKP